MTNNTIYTNTGTYGTLEAATVGPLVQYQAGGVMQITLLGLDGLAVDLTGRTITGTLTNNQTGVTSDITGAIAVDGVTPEAGLFTWTTSEADVAEAGSYNVIFSAAELDVITFPAHLSIIELSGGPPPPSLPPWWFVAGKTCVAAYQPIGAASLAASYVNLANPSTYNAAPGVAPTWASGTGWEFDGGSHYLITGIQTEHGYTTIVSIGVAGSPSTTDYVYGVVSTSPSTIVQTVRLSSATVILFRNGASGISVSIASPSNHVYAIAGATAYVDGTAEATPLDASWAYNPTPAGGVFLGARNFDGTALNHAEVVIKAFAIYSDTLSAPEVATLSAAMAALT